ncbi:primosomal protein N' [Patescibacteria group bacterium]
MFAEIILSRRFPKSLGVFDYQIPESLLSKIQVGHLVSIPFRTSLREGVVISIKKSAIKGKRIRLIDSIIDDSPVVSDKQLSLAKWMSSYYFVSQGTIIKMMLPEIPKRSFDLKELSWPDEQKLKEIDITPSEKLLLAWIHSNMKRFEWYYSFFRKIKGQTLVVTPEISMMMPLQSLIPSQIRPRTVFFHSKLGISESYDSWKKIRSGQSLLIIGTKIATFLPFHKLENVIIDQEQDDDHKQYDQNPRFDVRTTADTLRSLYGCHITYISPSPSINTYHRASEQQITVQRITSKRAQPPQVVDMQDERKKKNYSLISDALHDSIQSVISSNQKTFLFLNRRGQANAVMCQDCNTLIMCSNCHHPIAVHSEKSYTELLCHHCEIQHDLLKCANCSSIRFRYIGGGTQRLEKEIIKMFPKTTVSRIDTDSSSFNSDAQIIIGTELGRKMLKLASFGCIGIISGDSLFHLPDFRSSERTYHRLREIIAEASENAHIIIQTFSPNHIVMKSIREQDPDLFYLKELTERRELSYPPFTSLLKCIYNHTNKENATKHAHNLKSNLSPLTESHVLTPLAEKIRGKYRIYVIVKLPPLIEQQKLDKIISIIPDDWIIDRDPVSLL